jgi:hypothetical protein
MSSAAAVTPISPDGVKDRFRMARGEGDRLLEAVRRIGGLRGPPLAAGLVEIRQGRSMDMRSGTGPKEPVGYVSSSGSGLRITTAVCWLRLARMRAQRGSVTFSSAMDGEIHGTSTSVNTMHRKHHKYSQLSKFNESFIF